MIIEQIRLKNFRNYEDVDVHFEKGVNIITGVNGAGKTNLVEAIYFLSLARSFRTTEDNTLIKNNGDFALIDAVVKKGAILDKLKIVISKEGKKVEVNNNKVSKLSSLNEVCNVLVFEPKDALMYKGTPKIRRQFLDINLAKTSPVYFDCISRYEKILKERNEILKQDRPNKEHLEIVTNLLIKVSELIVKYRHMYFGELNPIVAKIYSQITNSNVKVEIKYVPFVIPNKLFRKNAKEAFNRSLEGDLRKKVTTIGIHREDFSIALNDCDISLFGSQGENRMMAIALKLSPYFLIKDQDKRPIIVLDDVMSELDKNNQTHLLQFLSKFEQVFITTTKTNMKNASIYEVKNNKISRRNH